nr:hypothetical protein [Tanacetum cinerariifolium]
MTFPPIGLLGITSVAPLVCQRCQTYLSRRVNFIQAEVNWVKGESRDEDVAVDAATGSGKTLAFIVLLVEILWRTNNDKPHEGREKMILKWGHGFISDITTHCIKKKMTYLGNMEDDVDINTLTIEQYLALIRDDIRPGVVKLEIGNDIEFEINRNFMRELRRKLFAGTDDEDAHEHLQRVLEIVDLFHFPGVTHDVVMFKVFPISLKGRALRWKKRLPTRVINAWGLLEKEFI